MRHALAAALVVLALGRAGTASATLVLRDLVVHGGGKTSLRAVRTRMGLDPGDVVDMGTLAHAEERLVQSNLFTSARVYVDMPREHAVRLMYLEDRVYSVDVHVQLEEKFSWFIVPNASFGAGDAAGGLVYGDSNLFGRDVQLLIAGQLGQAKSYGVLALRDPMVSFAPLTYSLATFYRREIFRFFEDHQRVFNLPTSMWGGEAQLGYIITPNTRALIGGKYSQIDVEAAEDLDPLRADPLYNPRSGHTVVLQLHMIYDRTSAPEGLPRGLKMALKNEASDRFWGSDFDFVKLDFSAELYGYFLRTYPSLIVRSMINYPTSSRGVPVTQLVRAGGGNLRGYLLNEFRGDTLLIAQVEDQIPLWKGVPLPWTSKRLNVALAVFADTGAVLERHPGGSSASSVQDRPPRFSDFHSSVGAGVRLVLPGVAIPAVKVDVGWGIDVSDYAITLSIASAGAF